DKCWWSDSLHPAIPVDLEKMMLASKPSVAILSAMKPALYVTDEHYAVGVLWVSPRTNDPGPRTKYQGRGKIPSYPMSTRTFTLDEAQDLLTVLESLLRSAIEGKRVIESVEAEFQAVTHQVFLRGGMSLNVVHLASRKAHRDKALQRVKDAMAEIDAIGVQVKDLDIGLLDFPCEVDGNIILLCWKLGEKSITHWHGVSEGFAGRKPVDERISKAKRAN